MSVISQSRHVRSMERWGWGYLSDAELRSIFMPIGLDRLVGQDPPPVASGAQGAEQR